MSDQSDNSLLIKLVEGQAALTQSMADVRHDVKGVVTALENFVPRREIEKDAATHAREHEEISKRITKETESISKRVEKLETKGAKWFGPIVGAICSLIVGVALFLLKWLGGVG